MLLGNCDCPFVVTLATVFFPVCSCWLILVLLDHEWPPVARIHGRNWPLCKTSAETPQTKREKVGTWRWFRCCVINIRRRFRQLINRDFTIKLSTSSAVCFPGSSWGRSGCHLAASYCSSVDVLNPGTCQDAPLEGSSSFQEEKKNQILKMDRVKTNSKNRLVLEEAPDGRRCCTKKLLNSRWRSVCFFCRLFFSWLIYSCRKTNAASSSNILADIMKNSQKNETRMRMIRCVKGWFLIKTQIGFLMNLYFTAYLRQWGRITAPGLSLDRDTERRHKSIFFKSLYHSSHLPKPSASTCAGPEKHPEFNRVAPPLIIGPTSQRSPASHQNPASSQKPRRSLTQSTQCNLHLWLVFWTFWVETFSHWEQVLFSRLWGPSRSILNPLLSNSCDQLCCTGSFHFKSLVESIFLQRKWYFQHYFVFLIKLSCCTGGWESLMKLTVKY